MTFSLKSNCGKGDLEVNKVKYTKVVVQNFKRRLNQQYGLMRAAYGDWLSKYTSKLTSINTQGKEDIFASNGYSRVEAVAERLVNPSFPRKSSGFDQLSHQS